MKYKMLGKTGIKVSELCFGVLPMGPLQANLLAEEGGQLLREAFEQGINFIDTAELYQTYPHIAHGLQGPWSRDIVIASKSTANDYQGMEKAIQDCLKALNRDVIDIFHIHAARVNAEQFKDKEGALECLVRYKEKGYIRAVGVSTHNVNLVVKAAHVPEIDVVYPIINKVGRGILEGTTEEMLKAIELCGQQGKGLYAMKVLAGGNLVGDLLDSISFARNIEEMDSISIGMIRKEELELNLKIFNDETITQEMLPEVINQKKLFISHRFCKKCGKCLTTCPNQALSFKDKNLHVDYDACLLCGYCYPVCPEFAIRMI